MIVRTLSCLAVGLFAATASAQSLDDVVQYRVLDGWAQSDGTMMAGLEIQLLPGWKTYWRAPGDAGIPPQFTWTGARNLKGVHVHYPTPDVFWQSGMRSVGYETNVVFPLTVVPKREGADVRLKGRVQIGVCSDICIPYTIRLDHTLTPEATARTPAIVAALANLPYSSDEAGLKQARCSFQPSEYGLMIEAELDLPNTGGTEEAVIEPPAPGIWVSDARAERRGGRLSVSAEMASQSGEAFAVDRSQVRITVLGANYAVDVRGCEGG